jgi:F-type H+-transporting ATPase subunit a
MTGLVPMADIKIGHHIERTFLGMTFNIDTIISTIVAGVLVLLLGFWATRSLTKDTDDHVPTKVQILWELVVGEVNKQVEDNLGKVHPFVAPLAISLFFFILFCNWLELVPTELNANTHLLPAPTADTNLTYALAAVKPITLALRLFGNIFAGGIMLALIGLIPLYAMWAPNILWKAFDAIIGVIQAFIFALLTVLYFAMAGAGHEEHESHEEHEDEQRKKKAAEAAEVSDEATPVPAH